MAATFDEIANLLVNGTTDSLSRIGKNETSRANRSNKTSASNPHKNVAAKTVSRRETQTKGVSRSSYLQSIEDSAGISSSQINDRATGGYLMKEDDGHRREMCSSPRLHPGLQLERLKDYQSDRGNQLSRVVYNDNEFSKIHLKDDGTCLPGTAPIEQTWTSREVKEIPIDDPLALKLSARGSNNNDDKNGREERKKPGEYYTGRKPTKMDNPGVGHYRPKFEIVEGRMTGGYITSPRSAAETPRGLAAAQQQEQNEKKIKTLPQSGSGGAAGANNKGSGGDPMEHSGRGGARDASNQSPAAHTANSSGRGSPTDNQNIAMKLDSRSHGDISKRPPFGFGTGFTREQELLHQQQENQKDGKSGNSNNNKSSGMSIAGRVLSNAPESGDYWPRPNPHAKRVNCFVDMAREKQNIDRNPPAIPTVDIAYPSAEGIALSLKSRTPRAFIAPKKPTDPAAHASVVVGHHAESAWVANATQKSAGGGAGSPVAGDRLDINPYKSKDSLVKHSASMVDFARSAKKSVTRTLPTDTSHVDLYDGRLAPSTKRMVNPVNMDRMSGRPPVVQAPDTRVTEALDDLVHARVRETKFAPLQPVGVQNRLAKLRADREGVPRLCGATDVSPVRPRIGAVGAVDFSKSTPRKDPTSGSLDLVYENLDPAITSNHKRIPGDPRLSTQVSRNKREQLAKPKWGALDRIYDTERGEKYTQPQHGTTTVYEFDKRVDRLHAYSGAMPSEYFIKKTTSGQPGPGEYTGELVPPMRGSPGRSFGKALK